MTFSQGLVQHSIRVLGNPPGSNVQAPSEVDLRRAVSSAYYALFHCLSQAAVEQLAPNVPPATANRVYRWLDHSEMKKICKEFSAPQLNPPLRDLLGNKASDDMRKVALNFLRLQEARHSADYDLDYQITWEEALELVKLAVESIGAWERISPSAESNIFVLSLLLWKKWEMARQ